MDFKILNTTRITFEEMLVDTFAFLTKKYNQSNVVFTRASPYLQIIEAIEEIVNLNFLYFEDALTEFNIYTAQRESSVYGTSRLSGHNPKRADAAKGSVEFSFKPGASNQIVGSFINFTEYPVLTCVNNDLKYTILNTRTKRIYKDSSAPMVYSLLQGRFQSQTFTGTGLKLQSFNVQQTNGSNIDNQYVTVRVNDQVYKAYDFLADIPRNSNGCIIMTGINGGIDVYFGNESFGKVPPKGSIIKVTYLETAGFSGNIERNVQEIEFQWEDTFTDSQGNSIDPNEIFSISLNEKVIFGTNSEDIEFTKLIANRGSTTNVLANPEKYVYYLNKLNLFSFVDAYATYNDDYLDDDNVVYLFLLPDIQRRLTSDTNYFTTNESNFSLTDQEETRIRSTIEESGQQIQQQELVFVKPVLRRYTLNIILKVFKGYEYNELRNEIIANLSDYFLTTRRRDIIPKSDIVRLVEGIDFIDSVNVEFISERNEAALRNGFYFKDTLVNKELVSERITLQEGEDPSLGLDEFGDIIIDVNELPIIRGGWFDRNNSFYEEIPELNKPSSINVIVQQEIDRTLSSIISSK